MFYIFNFPNYKPIILGKLFEIENRNFFCEAVYNETIDELNSEMTIKEILYAAMFARNSDSHNRPKIGFLEGELYGEFLEKIAVDALKNSDLKEG